MDEYTQIWNEYQMLREEIKTADSLNYQIMGIIVSAVALILTAAFSQRPLSRLLVFLCIYVITIPGYRLLCGNRRRIWRISTYIRVFLEIKLQFIKWETRVSNQRKNNKQKENIEEGKKSKPQYSSLVGKNEWYIITLMNLITLGAFVSTFIVQINEITSLFFGQVFLSYFVLLLVIALVVVLVISNSFQEYDLRRGGNVEMNFQKSWEKMLEEEK